MKIPKHTASLILCPGVILHKMLVVLDTLNSSLIDTNVSPYNIVQQGNQYEYNKYITTSEILAQLLARHNLTC